MTRLPWQTLTPPPEAASLRPTLVLLASEGRVIPERAVRLCADIARPAGAHVKVLSIARIWGSAFGMPHPGLKPTKPEWQAQRDIVAAAIGALKTQGIAAAGEVIGSRNAAASIISAAKAARAGAIVMAADAEAHWALRGLLWTQLPYVIARSSPIPVYLTTDRSVESLQAES